MSIRNTEKRTYSKLIEGRARCKELFVTREDEITKITPHIADEVSSAKDLARKYDNDPSLEPYNYYIGLEGDIYGGIPENYVTNVSGYSENDKRAITILISNSYESVTKPVSDASIESLVELSEDICRRYNFHLEYTGNATGSLTTHDMFKPKVVCPGPFLKGRLYEISCRVTNSILGLPSVPAKNRGFFRVRKSLNDKRSQTGIYRNLEEAILKAYKTQRNVYDCQGFEVYRYGLSSHVICWDRNAPIKIGDTVTSEPCFVFTAPRSNKCTVIDNGVFKVYCPDLGGFIRGDIVSETKETYGKFGDRSLHSGRSLITLDQGIVEDVDGDKVKVHGEWIPKNKLLIKRF